MAAEIEKNTTPNQEHSTTTPTETISDMVRRVAAEMGKGCLNNHIYDLGNTGPFDIWNYPEERQRG